MKRGVKRGEGEWGWIVLNGKKEKGGKKRRERKRERRGSKREREMKRVWEREIDGGVSGREKEGDC